MVIGKRKELRLIFDTAFVIEPFEPRGPEFETLCAEASSEKYDFVDRFTALWRNGKNQFDRKGERFLCVRTDIQLCAIGGLSRDPYRDDDVGRIRHVYVRQQFRGRGVGKLLLKQLLEHSQNHFPIVRLRASDEGATKFYDRLGFQRISEKTATHRISFNATETTRCRPPRDQQ